SCVSLRCVLPSLPRWNRSRLSASVLPRPMLPSPVLEWLGFQIGSHGACTTFDTCARSVASRPYAGFVRRYRAVLSPLQRVSSASTAPWPLPCRGFHSLGCTAFSSGHAEHEDEDGAAAWPSSRDRPISGDRGSSGGERSRSRDETNAQA